VRNKEYHLFNLLVLVCVLALFLYAWSDIRVISCPYADAGIQCRTCGLTTSFKSLLHGNWPVPPGHLFLFMFFASQVVLRPLVSYLLTISSRPKLIRNVDLVVSGVMVGVAYWSLFWG
jgi:hypothetical protein